MNEYYEIDKVKQSWCEAFHHLCHYKSKLQPTILIEFVEYLLSKFADDNLRVFFCKNLRSRQLEKMALLFSEHGERNVEMDLH